MYQSAIITYLILLEASYEMTLSVVDPIECTKSSRDGPGYPMQLQDYSEAFRTLYINVCMFHVLCAGLYCAILSSSIELTDYAVR